MDSGKHGLQEACIISRIISTSLHEKIISRNIIPDKGITLGDLGNIPLVTIGDTAFPKHA